MTRAGPFSLRARRPQCLDRLSEAHVIRQDASDAPLGEPHQPREALALVGAQARPQARGHPRVHLLRRLEPPDDLEPPGAGFDLSCLSRELVDHASGLGPYLNLRGAGWYAGDICQPREAISKRGLQGGPAVGADGQVAPAVLHGTEDRAEVNAVAGDLQRSVR